MLPSTSWNETTERFSAPHLMEHSEPSPFGQAYSHWTARAPGGNGIFGVGLGAFVGGASGLGCARAAVLSTAKRERVKNNLVMFLAPLGTGYMVPITLSDPHPLAPSTKNFPSLVASLNGESISLRTRRVQVRALPRWRRG